MNTAAGLPLNGVFVKTSGLRKEQHEKSTKRI